MNHRGKGYRVQTEPGGKSGGFLGGLANGVSSCEPRFHRIARLWTNNEDQEAALAAQRIVEAGHALTWRSAVAPSRLSSLGWNPTTPLNF